MVRDINGLTKYSECAAVPLLTPYICPLHKNDLGKNKRHLSNFKTELKKKRLRLSFKSKLHLPLQFIPSFCHLFQNVTASRAPVWHTKLISIPSPSLFLSQIPWPVLAFAVHQIRNQGMSKHIPPRSSVHVCAVSWTTLGQDSAHLSYVQSRCV